MTDGDGGQGIPNRAIARTNASEPLRECDLRFVIIEEGQKKHDLALFGEGGMDGIVSDIAKIKWQTGIAKTIINAAQAILISVVTTFLTAWVMGALR